MYILFRFKLDPVSAVLSLADCNKPGTGNCLDHESVSQYDLSIIAAGMAMFDHPAFLSISRIVYWMYVSISITELWKKLLIVYFPALNMLEEFFKNSWEVLKNFQELLKTYYFEQF